MGEGLKKVAKLCGGLTAKNKRVSVTYNADGKKIKVVRNRSKRR